MQGHRTRLLFVLAIVVAAGIGIVIATTGGDDDSQSAASGDCQQVAKPPPKKEQFKKPEPTLARGQDATATVATSCGEFTIDLDTQQSPKTTNSFAFLADKGFYDGTIFHRIVARLRDPGRRSDRDRQRRARLHGHRTAAAGHDLRERRGRDGEDRRSSRPGASGSQFFVVTAPADAGLPPDYAVLGRVTDGMDVVKAIGKLGDAQEQPTQVVTIDKVTIEN